MLEWAQRGNLFHFLRKHKNLSEKQKVGIFEKVCRAIDFVHDEGVIHRDIKPENILIGTHGEIKLCDFGWAAALNTGGCRNTFCGTYEYMAPEIYRNKAYDKKIDIWSLGILLYELLHGYSPFKGKAMKDVYSNILKRKIIFNDSVCIEAKNLIIQILNPLPKERPSVKEIIQSEYLKKFIFAKEAPSSEERPTKPNINYNALKKALVDKEGLAKLRIKIKENSLFAPVHSEATFQKPPPMKENMPHSRKHSHLKHSRIEAITAPSEKKKQNGSQEIQPRVLSKFSSSKMLSDRSKTRQLRVIRSPTSKNNPEGKVKKPEAIAVFPRVKKTQNFESSYDSRAPTKHVSAVGFRSPQLLSKMHKTVVSRKENSYDPSQFNSQLPGRNIKPEGGSFLKRLSKNMLDKIDKQGEGSYLKSFNHPQKGNSITASRSNVPEFKSNLIKSIKENLISEQTRQRNFGIESISCSKSILDRVIEKQKNFELMAKSPIMRKRSPANKFKVCGSFEGRPETEMMFKKKKVESMHFNLC